MARTATPPAPTPSSAAAPRAASAIRYGWALVPALLLIGRRDLLFLFLQHGGIGGSRTGERGTALQGVYGTVDVEPVNEVIVRTRNFGMISALKFKAGDEVKTGPGAGGNLGRIGPARSRSA